MNAAHKVRKWSLAFTAAALLGSPALSQTSVEGVTVHTGPSEAVQVWSEAVEAGDALAIARMNTPETVVYGPDSMVTRGVDSIVIGYRKMFEKYRPKVEIRDAAWIRQGPLLNSWGQYTLTLVPREGGTPVRVDGRFSDVALWVDGRWQYVMDHASSPTRPAPGLTTSPAPPPPH